jgi:hypothetical protein
MSTSDSYIIQDAAPESSNDQDEIDSLPSSIDSSDLDSEEESDAQREWEASLQQLELVLTMVIIPYVGKYFGRKFAYWSESISHYFYANIWGYALISYFRLGKVDGMEVSCRSTVHE